MDKKLLESLYHKYYKEIVLYLYSLSRSRELAEDLAQETFLKAILSLPKKQSNLRAWLYAVARNLFYNDYKKQKRVTYMDELPESADPQQGDLLSEILRGERDRLLYDAMLQLDVRKREIIMMHYFSGMPMKEIAAVLKLTTENVKVLACRGKREIRNYMEAHGYDIS